MRPSLLLPACLVLSAIIHVVLLTAVAIPRQRVTHGQTMTVDLVTPDEVPQKAGEMPQKAGEPPSEQPAPEGPSETVPRSQPDVQQPAPAPVQQASIEPSPTRGVRQGRQQAPAPQQQVQPQVPPPAQHLAQPERPEAKVSEIPVPGNQLPPDTLADQAERLSAMLNLPGQPTGDGTGAEAIKKAKLTREEVAAFRAHLRSCWKLPAGVVANQRLKMVIRLSLRRDGGLAGEPALIEGAAPDSNAELAKAVAVRDEALRTIRQCAPYSMLPPEKYREWQVLDVDFSPDQMSNG